MPRDIAQDYGERADTEPAMAGNRNVMLATLVRRQPQMAPRLARDFVPEAPEGAGEGVPAEVAGKFHAVMTSSRTK